MQDGQGRAWCFLGQTRVSGKNRSNALFPITLSDTPRDAVSCDVFLAAYTEQWPSLQPDQGITLNPPDTCHEHARAENLSEKQIK